MVFPRTEDRHVWLLLVALGIFLGLVGWFRWAT
jgi:hypothetical protein